MVAMIVFGNCICWIILDALQLLIVSHQAQPSCHSSHQTCRVIRAPNNGLVIAVRRCAGTSRLKVYSRPKPAFHRRKVCLGNATTGFERRKSVPLANATAVFTPLSAGFSFSRA